MTPEHWKRVGELFEAAVEREPAARAEFLARAAAGETALAEEVLRLLASDENAGTFMSTPRGLGYYPWAMAILRRGWNCSERRIQLSRRI